MILYKTDISIISELGITTDTQQIAIIKSTLAASAKGYSIVINGDPDRTPANQRGNGVAIIARTGINLSSPDVQSNPRLVTANIKLGSTHAPKIIKIVGVYGPSGCTSIPLQDTRDIESRLTEDLTAITGEFEADPLLHFLITAGDMNSISSPGLDTHGRIAIQRDESTASILDSLMDDAIRTVVPSEILFTRTQGDNSAAYIDRIYSLTKPNGLKLFTAGIDTTTRISDHHIVFADFIGITTPPEDSFKRAKQEHTFDSMWFRECAEAALNSQDEAVRENFRDTITAQTQPYESRITQLTKELQAVINKIEVAAEADASKSPIDSTQLQKLRTQETTSLLDTALSMLHEGAQAAAETQGLRPAAKHSPRDRNVSELLNCLRKLQKTADDYAQSDGNLSPDSFERFLDDATELRDLWNIVRTSHPELPLGEWTTNPLDNPILHSPPPAAPPKSADELASWRHNTRRWIEQYWKPAFAPSNPMLKAPTAIHKSLKQYNSRLKEKKNRQRKDAHHKNSSEFYKLVRLLKDNAAPASMIPEGATNGNHAKELFHAKYSGIFGRTEETDVNQIVENRQPDTSAAPEWHFKTPEQIPINSLPFLRPALERKALTFPTAEMHGPLSEDEKKIFSPSSRAPGPSRIQRSVFAYLPPSWRALYLICLEICVRISVLPNFAKKTLIFLIPKPDGGERPLTLLEDFTKCAERILKHRLNTIRYGKYKTGDLLNDGNVAYEQGRATSAMLIPLQIALADALETARIRIANYQDLPTEDELIKSGAKPIVLLAWDFLKFFDLVQTPIPFALMRKRGINSLTVMFLEHMYDGLTHQIITPWGPTALIARLRGICQGAIFSDIIARFAVDIFYCYMNEKFQGYYSLGNTAGPTITSKAYSDDGAALFSTEYALTRWLQDASSIARIIHLGFKPKALKILTNFSLASPKTITYPNTSGALETTPIAPHGPDHTIKILGVRISVNNPAGAQTAAYAKSITWMLNGLKRNSFTPPEIITAIRTVLIPMISYCPLDTALPESILHKWDTLATIHLRNSLGLSPKTARSFLYVDPNDGGMGLKSFATEYVAATARELMYELDPTSPSSALLTWLWNRLATSDPATHTNSFCILTEAVTRLARWGTYIRSSKEVELNAILDALASRAANKSEHGMILPWTSGAANTASTLANYSSLSTLAYALRETLPPLDNDFWPTVTKSLFWEARKHTHRIGIADKRLVAACTQAMNNLRDSFHSEMHIFHPSTPHIPTPPSPSTNEDNSSPWLDMLISTETELGRSSSKDTVPYDYTWLKTLVKTFNLSDISAPSTPTYSAWDGSYVPDENISSFAAITAADIRCPTREIANQLCTLLSATSHPLKQLLSGQLSPHIDPVTHTVTCVTRYISTKLPPFIGNRKMGIDEAENLGCVVALSLAEDIATEHPADYTRNIRAHICDRSGTFDAIMSPPRNARNHEKSKATHEIYSKMQAVRSRGSLLLDSSRSQYHDDQFNTWQCSTVGAKCRVHEETLLAASLVDLSSHQTDTPFPSEATVICNQYCDVLAKAALSFTSPPDLTYPAPSKPFYATTDNTMITSSTAHAIREREYDFALTAAQQTPWQGAIYRNLSELESRYASPHHRNPPADCAPLRALINARRSSAAKIDHSNREHLSTLLYSSPDSTTAALRNSQDLKLILDNENCLMCKAHRGSFRHHYGGECTHPAIHTVHTNTTELVQGELESIHAIFLEFEHLIAFPHNHHAKDGLISLPDRRHDGAEKALKSSAMPLFQHFLGWGLPTPLERAIENGDILETAWDLAYRAQIPKAFSKHLVSLCNLAKLDKADVECYDRRLRLHLDTMHELFKESMRQKRALFRSALLDLRNQNKPDELMSGPSVQPPEPSQRLGTASRPHHGAHSVQTTLPAFKFPITQSSTKYKNCDGPLCTKALADNAPANMIQANSTSVCEECTMARTSNAMRSAIAHYANSLKPESSSFLMTPEDLQNTLSNESFDPLFLRANRPHLIQTCRRAGITLLEPRHSRDKSGIIKTYQPIPDTELFRLCACSTPTNTQDQFVCQYCCGILHDQYSSIPQADLWAPPDHTSAPPQPCSLCNHPSPSDANCRACATPFHIDFKPPEPTISREDRAFAANLRPPWSLADISAMSTWLDDGGGGTPGLEISPSYWQRITHWGVVKSSATDYTPHRNTRFMNILQTSPNKLDLQRVREAVKDPQYDINHPTLERIPATENGNT